MHGGTCECKSWGQEGRPGTVLGLAPWEVAEGRAAEKSLPAMPGQTARQTPGVFPHEGWGGQVRSAGDGNWDMLEGNETDRLSAGNRRRCQADRRRQPQPHYELFIISFRSSHF